MNNTAIAFVAGAALALLGVLAVKPLLAGEPEIEVPPIEIRETAPAIPEGKREKSHHRRPASRSRHQGPVSVSGSDDAGFAPTPATPTPAPPPSAPGPAQSSPPSPPPSGDDLDDDGAESDDTGTDDDAGDD